MIATAALILAMTSADAVATILNSPNAIDARTYEEARKTVAQEAAEGKPLQQFVIGVTTDDKELARKYLDASRGKIKVLAEQKDNPLAWYLLSLETNNMDLLRKAAARDNVQALNALGTIEMSQAFGQASGMSTNDLPVLMKRCFMLFRRAAELKDPNGYINLGTCYLRGLGCSKNLKLAFECFCEAAKAGHPEGMDNVSACYQFGHGVEKDAELSLVWAMRGRAARGDEAAAKWLRDRK